VLESLYQKFQQWEAGELDHLDMDEAIHQTHKQNQAVYVFFTQKRDWLVRVIQLGRAIPKFGGRQPTAGRLPAQVRKSKSGIRKYPAESGITLTLTTGGCFCCRDMTGFVGMLVHVHQAATRLLTCCFGLLSARS